MSLAEKIKTDTDSFVAAINKLQAGTGISPDEVKVDLVAVVCDTDNAQDLQNNGIDRIAFFNYTEDEAEREAYLESARAL